MAGSRWTWLALATCFAQAALAAQTIATSSSLIFYHGRWDSLPSTWWPSSGFKLSFTTAPTSLTLNVGSTASTPPIQVGVRFGDSGEYTTLNLTAGANSLPVSTLVPASPKYPLTFDVVTQFEGGESRLELQSIVLDDGAKLAAYTNKKIVFEFIGDSLTAGYLTPRGSLDDYAFKVGEAFGAEHNQIAQSGICLVSLAAGCWGNPLGMDQNYFKTQNSAYQWLNGNTTTAWDFSKYSKDTPTHIVIALGTNDQSNNVTSAQFQSTYTTFLKNLRAVYKTQPIFAMSPWGYPYDGGVAPYWETETANAVTAVADSNTYLMKGYGWLPYAANNVNYYSDGHPTPTGHTIIANNMIAWLKKWGLAGGNTTTTTSSSSSSSSSTSTSSSSSSTTTGTCAVAKWGQCAGSGYSGCKSCASGTTCVYVNDWYSQCQ